MADQSAKFQALQKIRADIVKLKESREAVKNAPPPAKILIDQKHAQVDQLVDYLCSTDVDIRRFYHPHDVASLFVAVHAEDLKKTIAARIQKNIGKSGLTVEEKAARFAEIDRELLELEREEEKLCVELEAESVPVVRRGDLNPAVFFEV